MTTRTGLILGVVVGFVLGALFIGTAFAISRAIGFAMHPGAPPAYSMMSGFGRGEEYGRSSAREMNRFMDSYRDADGSIDFDRMHRDVARDGSDAPYGRGEEGPGPDGRRGYGMMGWPY